VIDHIDELQRVAHELPTNDAVIFVRMAAHNSDATYDLSEKFGASLEDTAMLLREIVEIGMQPALAFNVGSLVRRPEAYESALENCARVLEDSKVVVRLLDVGGGFPSDYPGMPSAPLGDFFRCIAETRDRLPALHGIELLAEPGRALVAGGFSLLVQVLHRNGNRLFLNDGVWGSMVEPMLSKGELRYPSRAFHGTEQLRDAELPFEIFGPTCDSLDRLPAPFPLPATVKAGDWIEFGTIGAYSLSNRTRFNGFYPDTMVEIIGADSAPPGIKLK
jgi:ornithine decarboxylase